MSSDLISIKVKVLYHGPKAWRIQWAPGREVWMPRSMCELKGNVLTTDDAFAAKKEIDLDLCKLVKRPEGPPLCHYCGKPSVKTTGAEVYPNLPKLHDKTMYLCRACSAWVGCHPGTDAPLGMLANAELRKAKQDAHEAFDPLWKNGGPMKRKAAYAWLAVALGEPPKKTHIGMFDVGMCRRVVKASLSYRAELEAKKEAAA